MSRTFRAFVTVYAPNRDDRALHDIATNPRDSWAWTDGNKTRSGFKRLDDAKADAERAHGPIAWHRPHGGRVRGDYGAEMTADEYLQSR